MFFSWGILFGDMKNMGKWWFNGGLMGFHGIYPLVSSNMSSWKIPELKGGVNRTITDKWFIFQQAMFDYQRVWLSFGGGCW